MYKCFILLAFLLLHNTINAQHFQWACSSNEIYHGIDKSCMLANGNIAAAYNFETLNIMLRNEPTLYNANGKEKNIDIREGALYVEYNTKGVITNQVDFRDFSTDSYIVDLVSGKNNNTIVIFRVNNLRHPNLKIIDTSNTTNVGATNYWQYTFFATIQNGAIIEIVGTNAFKIKEVGKFNYCNQGFYVFSFNNYKNGKNYYNLNTTVGYNHTYALDESFNVKWHHQAELIDSSCCTTYSKNLCTTDDAGNVYICGSAQTGVRLDGDKAHFANKVLPYNQYNKGFDSYLAMLNKNGQLQWANYSNTKGIINDIAATKNGVVTAGNHFNIATKLFNINIDTSLQTAAIAIHFSNKGKVLWHKGFVSSSIKAVTASSSGDVIFYFGENHNYKTPLVLGKDTLKNQYVNFTPVCLDNKGNYKWHKVTKVSITDNNPIRLFSDKCGNICFAGTMFYSLKIPFTFLDAAILKGGGSGDAPIVGAIKTTIPDEVIEINKELIQTKPEDAICIPIPAPWSISAYPNPCVGTTLKLECSVSYNDKNVGIELYNLNGQKIKNILDFSTKQSGIFTIETDVSTLPRGRYIVLLKGTESGASTIIDLK